MSSPSYPISKCTCGICSLGVEHPEQILHTHINLLMSCLNEQQRRWLAAILAENYGLELRGVHLVAQITGLDEKTIRRGLKDLESHLADAQVNYIRKPGAGRPHHNKIDNSSK